MAKTKQRLDQLLVSQGYFQSREQAKRSIMAGLVYVDNQRVDKPGTSVATDLPITIKGKLHPYVSRGGLKLEKALDVFGVDVTDFVAIDVGASTGGFTDCLLQNNAKKVYAVDVGYGQLDWKLRSDPRVIVMERTNIRYVTPDDLNEQVQLATIDVAFISLTKFFKELLELLTDNGQVIALIKPQFEAGREFVGKKGVVRDFNVHSQVLQSLTTELQGCGIGLLNLDYSPIRGPEGNIEYLAHFSKGNPIIEATDLIQQVIESAKNDSHLCLGRC